MKKEGKKATALLFDPKEKSPTGACTVAALLSILQMIYARGVAQENSLLAFFTVVYPVAQLSFLSLDRPPFVTVR